MATINASAFFQQCAKNDDLCEDAFTECFTREESECYGEVYSDRYDDASAVWVILCAILMFFMKAGFMFLESSFASDEAIYVRRVVFAKYIDIFAGTFGFWLLGYAISGNTDVLILGEDQDYIFWFFRFTFATNTATIIGGTLVGNDIQMTGMAIFVYSFLMTAFIHPFLARLFWSSHSNANFATWSPYDYCNGTFTANQAHTFEFLGSGVDQGEFTFIDFAGSGLVHICGGIGGLVLAIVHKLETKNIKGRCCCSRTHRRKINTKEHDDADDNVKVEGDDGTYANIREKKSKGLFEVKGNWCINRLFKGFVDWLYPVDGGTESVQNAALGVLILWTTWFAFNAGSTESISGKSNHVAVGRIALTMCLSSASAGLVQAIVSSAVQWLRGDKHINTNEIANAVLGGLVAVTGCCPFIDPPIAIFIGAVSVLFYHVGCFIEYIPNLHDGAKVFPLHAMCGFWGVLCVGLFSKHCLIRELYEKLCFCVYSELPSYLQDGAGNETLFAYQFAGALVITLWSATCCFVIFFTLWLLPWPLCRPCFKWAEENDDQDGNENAGDDEENNEMPPPACQCLCHNSALFTYLEGEGSMMEQRPAAGSIYREHPHPV